jgi:transcription elongation factor Elf1
MREEEPMNFADIVEHVESQLKGTGHRLKCPWCGCISLLEGSVEQDGSAVTVELECKSCGTRFAVYAETLPKVRESNS